MKIVCGVNNTISKEEEFCYNAYSASPRTVHLP